MIYSGILILVFVVLHVKTFKYGDQGAGTLYDLVMHTFRDPLYAGGYVFAMIVLGFHLWHAFQSALQSLGFQARKKLHLAGIILCLILAGGFAFIPLWTFFTK